MRLKSGTTRTTLSLKGLSSSSSNRSTNCSRQLSSSNEASNFPRIENILVLGAGTMGSGKFSSNLFKDIFIKYHLHPGIAQSCAVSGRFTSVTLHDVSLIALSKARERILASLTRQQQLKVDGEAAAESILNRITLSTRYYTSNGGSGKSTTSRLLIIEAIPEVLELKQTLFRNLK